MAVAVMRAAGLEPLEQYPGSKAPWRCRCTSCGDIVLPRYNTIQQGLGRGCNRCGKIRGGLARRLPELDAIAVMRAARVDPLDSYPGSMKPWRCVCMTCHREVQPRLHNVQRGRRACAYCSRQKVDAHAATQAMIAAGVRPLTGFPGVDTPWQCECLRCGKAVTPRYSSIKAGQTGCKYCAGRAVDIADAIVLMRRADLAPRAPWPGADQPWESLCHDCGRTVYPAYNNVRRGHAGCGHCAGTIVDPALAERVMRANGLQPLTRYPGAAVPWHSRCQTCKSIVTPRYAGIRAGQGGCRGCAKYGFDPNVPAVVYLVTSGLHDAVKIGISNRGANRLAEHARAGWLPHRFNGRPCIWPTPTGRQAERIEEEILLWWREELIVPPAVTFAHMPQRGASETASLSLIDLDLTVAKIIAMYAAVGGCADPER